MAVTRQSTSRILFRYEKASNPNQIKDVTFKLEFHDQVSEWLTDRESSRLERERDKFLNAHTFVFNKRVGVRKIEAAICRRIITWDIPYRMHESMAERITSNIVQMVNSEKDIPKLVIKCKVIYERCHTYYVRSIADVIMRRSMEESGSGMVPASDSSIDSLQSKKMTESESCSVCFEDFYIGCEALCLPCLHSFHGDCIRQWLKTSHYCPNCRYEMPTK